MKQLLPLILAATVSAEPPTLKEAEVRLSFAELSPLLDAARAKPAPAALPASLAAVRLRLSWDGDRPLIDASFRTLGFSTEPALVPLIGGPLAIESRTPPETALLVRDGMICHAVTAPGATDFQTRILLSEAEPTLRVPACPTVLLEVAELPDKRRLVLAFDHHERILAAGEILALPANGEPFTLRGMSAADAERSLRPPEPSSWSWQHLALVARADGELDHTLVSRASAADGSGLSAGLVLPADARDVRVQGEDLEKSRLVRQADGSGLLELDWKTRDLLEREVLIRYRRPLRPLDPEWRLGAPSAPEEGPVRTRFLVAADPQLDYQAAEIAGPFPPDLLPEVLRAELRGSSYFSLEAAGASAALGVRALPLVATAEAIIPEANWTLKVEGDGALLTEGELKIRHQGPLRFKIDTPDGFSLLACTVNGGAVRPVDLGGGGLEIPLPAATGEPSRVGLSFTGRTETLDPVEGTLALTLPRTPLFISTLLWRIELPPGLRAETFGNLSRMARAPNDPRSVIRLEKNLCHDETPSVSVFHQRADLARP